MVAVSYRRSSYRYLSPQQERVAQMLAKGYSNKAIAINLDCCLTTAQKETRYVIRKYGASNRTMAALMIAGVLPPKGVMAELEPQPPHFLSKTHDYATMAAA